MGLAAVNQVHLDAGKSVNQFGLHILAGTGCCVNPPENRDYLVGRGHYPVENGHEGTFRSLAGCLDFTL